MSRRLAVATLESVAPKILSRAREQDATARFLAASADAPAALVLAGPAGTSMRVLEFAVRRVTGHVGVLVTERADAADEAPLGLRRTLPDERLDVVLVGPLDRGASPPHSRAPG